MQARQLHRSAVLLLLALATAACSDVTAPGAEGGPTPEPGPGRWNALGLVEVTLTDLGGPAPSARANVVGGASLPGGAAHAVSTIPGGSGNGSIQLRSVSSGSFTVGTRAGGGFRYVYSTFQVRNAASNGTAYDTDRHNLTLLAVATPSTLGGTAVSRLSRYDGSAASPAIAAGIRPTGAVAFDRLTASLVPHTPDVLQVYDEGDVASVPVVSGGSVLPWGFVVGNPTATDSRTLPAAPAADRWDGLVTFAFKVPLQPTAAEDPFTVSFVFVAVDDPETRLTISPEEQTPAGAAAALGRAGMLGAGVTTLARYPVAGATRTICSVRTAGTRAAPTASLFPGVGAALDSLLPGPGRLLGRTGRLGAAFDCPVSAVPTGASFVVHGSGSGRWFLGGGFTGAGTRTVQSPQGAFVAGEEVEVTLTSALTGGAGRVGRYRVGSAPATGAFTATAAANIGTLATDIGVAELTGDGQPDLVVAEGGTVRLLAGTGAGTFGPATDLGFAAALVRTGDMNADGRSDLVTVSGGQVAIHLGSPTGFTPAAGSPFVPPSGTLGLRLGDMNADGRLDLVAIHGNAVTVIPGDGSGGVQLGAAATAPIPTPRTLVLADANRDGRLDAVTLSIANGSVSVTLGNGAGGFGATVTTVFGDEDNPRTVELADLTGDGLPDLIVGTLHDSQLSTPVGVHLLAGSGTGAFAAVPALPLQVPGLGSLAGAPPADVDGDGRLDLVVAGGGGIQVLLQRGTGFSLLPGGPFLAGPDRVVALPTDVSGDGRLDLLGLSGSGTLHLLLNR